MTTKLLEPIIAIEKTGRAGSFTNAEANKLDTDDRAVHDWYRFVLSFPPHLVRHCLRKFNLRDGSVVLDPFCGTGTTIVEAKKLGISAVGVEANPVAHFASETKVDWRADGAELIRHARRIERAARRKLAEQGIDDDEASPLHRGSLRALPDELKKLLLTDSISPLPLHKTLVLLETIRRLRDERFFRHEMLALASAVVHDASNLHFGPEVGVGKIKANARVLAPWLARAGKMAADLQGMKAGRQTSATIHHSDARELVSVLRPGSVDAVITSPPYPNEKDYSRTTRLEAVLLGFINSKDELKAVKKTLVRSNTRGVYKEDDDDRWVADHPEISRIAAEIEARRIALGKTSGFERMYARVTKLYFGGMARHLADLRTILRPGAQLAYVVGDQASYLRIMIRTGSLLADIARSLGYELVGIDLFRTRLATATKEQLREEVVVLRWPGRAGKTRGDRR